ncbi:hypothetical protein BOO69_14095 [Sulfitobacter alexandrii]|uniref:Uncharacterized protein n=1 Tax=Sulfitobacter alexandrii TaxID=1917485 RepID=A0A1J0WJE0_9RHOB|nr:hypothetical protein BOO69_14095 [Sulfitobacter alexandrii]
MNPLAPSFCLTDNHNAPEVHRFRFCSVQELIGERLHARQCIQIKFFDCIQNQYIGLAWCRHKYTGQIVDDAHFSASQFRSECFGMLRTKPYLTGGGEFLIKRIFYKG